MVIGSWKFTRNSCFDLEYLFNADFSKSFPAKHNFQIFLKKLSEVLFYWWHFWKICLSSLVSFCFSYLFKSIVFVTHFIFINVLPFNIFFPKYLYFMIILKVFIEISNRNNFVIKLNCKIIQQSVTLEQMFWFTL